jgi:D-psicose/D-tagatose/L-ribulose 3-epimerase
MQYGAHVYLWQDRYDDRDLARIVERAQRLGLQFLEVSVGDDIHFDAKTLERAANDHELRLAFSPGGVWPMECDISLEDTQHRQAGIDWHRRAIDVAAAAGGMAYAGAIYGHPGRVERRLPCPDEPKRISDGLRVLADHAAARDVRLVLEPMSHFRTHVATSPRQINELISLTGHDNLFSLLDTYHLATEVTDLAAAFDEMRPRLWGLHACENNRGAPGTGLLPWQSLISAIHRSGWEGCIGFESYNSTCRGGAFARERGMFHNVCDDAETFIRQGKTFLERCFENCRSDDHV